PRLQSSIYNMHIALVSATSCTREKIIVSKLGENTTLSCIYQGRELHLKNLRVYWQIADDQEECTVVHALISGQDNESEQCIHFKNRTQLFWDRLENGDFSLLLLNVNQGDEHTYKCVVLEKAEYTSMVHQAEVVLSLAGKNFNSDSTGEEVTFSCRSGNGYPEPNLYWINKTDNSHLPPSELMIIPNSNGTYSVFSTLKVKATSNMQIECSIENKILQENLSANCKSLHATSCFLAYRDINHHVSLCREVMWSRTAYLIIAVTGPASRHTIHSEVSAP
uniref:Ig-like domain-containing protein n=1 Tax=Amazona collaria TaxID=241587 RepID=A0A8B9FHP1_9PSIT